MTLQEKIQQAELALHQLVTGTKKVTIRYENTSVTYNQANIAELRAYLADLKARAGQLRRGGPFPVQFT